MDTINQGIRRLHGLIGLLASSASLGSICYTLLWFTGISTMIKRSVLGVVLALSSAPAPASELVVHLASSHLGASGYNERNLGVGVVLDSGWTAGAYRNSLSRTSMYAGYSWMPLRAKHASLGVSMGAITGYRSSVVPFVAPELRLRANRSVVVSLHYVPAVEFQGAKTVAAVGLSLVLGL